LPSVRSAVENGADLKDGDTIGAIVGASYKFSDSLSLGPGLGVFSQLEERPRVFPVVFVDWKLTDTLRVRTGRGLGASQGPGLSLEWRPIPALDLGLEVRYEKFRFRLDDTGVASGGVGQDRSLPVALSANYKFSRALSLALTGGVEFAGNLRLEDKGGNKLASTDYDPAPFLGFTFRAGF
jgi:hypothetical protein